MVKENHKHIHSHKVGHSHEDSTEHTHTPGACSQSGHSHETGLAHAHGHEAGLAHAHDVHGHSHSHTQTKAVLNRLSRIIGHLESVKRMVEQGRDCSEVLVQLAAVDSAVKGVSRVVMKDHIEHCLVEAVKTNDHETLEKLNEAIDRFIK
ncbi:metal-sensing transcriptional repressor [uncultured Veillonella sp.]|uniref:metal-sensing transcriptional repressor n=1 Tax=uncultured Veillonella sp. TaxID=159268 RepID=UPI00260E6591|nr:metal-sensing transcriptional repressor [uncultured Veillonella sp.]